MAGDTQITVSIVAMVALLPLLVRLTRRNRIANGLLFEGWTPLVLSMMIASMSGILLEHYIQSFTALALLAPIVNGTLKSMSGVMIKGIAGNLGGIYTSRITTALHAGVKERDVETMYTLTVAHAPLQLVTLACIYAFALGNLTASIPFTALYVFLTTLLVRGFMSARFD
jgi:solute carrier family 41